MLLCKMLSAGRHVDTTSPQHWKDSMILAKHHRHTMQKMTLLQLSTMSISLISDHQRGYYRAMNGDIYDFQTTPSRGIQTTVTEASYRRDEQPLKLMFSKPVAAALDVFGEQQYVRPGHHKFISRQHHSLSGQKLPNIRLRNIDDVCMLLQRGSHPTRSLKRPQRLFPCFEMSRSLHLVLQVVLQRLTQLFLP